MESGVECGRTCDKTRRVLLRKKVSLTLLATGVKVLAYAPGRMKAAARERARHLQLAEPVFRLFGVPESPLGALTDSTI